MHCGWDESWVLGALVSVSSSRAKKRPTKVFQIESQKIGGSELFIELFVCIHKYKHMHTQTHKHTHIQRQPNERRRQRFRLIFACKFAQNRQRSLKQKKTIKIHN